MTPADFAHYAMTRRHQQPRSIAAYAVLFELGFHAANTYHTATDIMAA